MCRLICICTYLLINISKSCNFVVVQFPSHVQLFATPWTSACQGSLSLTISWSVPKFMSIESVVPSNHLILCHRLLLLPSIFPNITVFSNESAVCIRCPKYWSCSFSINSSKEYSGLISFKIDWFDLLAVQGLSAVFSSPQFENIDSLVLCLLYPPALISIHDYWKNHNLDYMDLCRQSVNTLSRFVIAFVPRSNCLLIAWLQSPSTVILEPKKRKFVTASTFSPSICHEVMGPVAMILVFLILSFNPVFLTTLLHLNQ